MSNDPHTPPPTAPLEIALQQERARRADAEAQLADARRLLRRTSDLLHRAGKGTIDLAIAARAVTDATEEAIADAVSHPLLEGVRATDDIPAATIAPAARINLQKPTTSTPVQIKQRIARCAMRARDHEGALLLFQEIAQSEPSCVEHLLSIASCQLRMRQHAAAAATYYTAAQRYAADGYYLKAVAMHKTCCNDDPSWPPESVRLARHALAQLYRKLDCPTEALTQLQLLLQSSATDDPERPRLEEQIAALTPPNASPSKQ